MSIEVTATGSPISVTATGSTVAASVSATTVSTTAASGQGPQGDKGATGSTGATGPANTLTIGTVTSGATAAATITGTAPAQTLNLTLPKGDTGEPGATGATGAQGQAGETGPPGTTTWAGITDKPTEFPPEAHQHTAADVSGLAAVATSGAYGDLSGAPSLATVATSGAYADLSGTPSLATVATSGAYGDLSGTPSLASVATSGAYADLSGAPTLATVATSGDYADLSGTPALNKVATSGSYNDLSDTPSLATVATSGNYADLSGLPSLATVATSGAYSDLTGTPTLGKVATSDNYADLTGTPSLATVATSGAYADLSGLPSLVAVATSGAYSDLTGTPSSMTPTAHAASHKTGGTDALTASDIGAAASSHTHTLAAITDAGTAASKSVPATGNASATQVVLGSDTRLSDSRSPTSHNHAASEITSGTIASARLPAATTTTSGAVIVGSGISVSSGTISATAASVGAAATSHSHGNLDANGLISGNTSSDYFVVTQAGGALGLSSSVNEYQVYVSDIGTGSFASDDFLGNVLANIDSAFVYTNGTVSTANTNITALQTADTYLPGYDGIADADDWVSRVTTAGGSVSTATRAAVTRFCVAITAAGLRSKFTRLSALCGSSLTAALVPIYRGPARTGTQYGSTTDTNNNFVSGSYSEASGLTGNASTRYLTVGTFAGLRSNWATGHFGIDYTGADSTDRYLMGGFFNEGLTSPRGWYRIWGSTTYGINGVFGNPTKSGFTQTGNLKIVNRSSSTSLWFYENGERVSTETTTSNTSTEQPGGQFCIMAASYTNVSGGVATTSVNGYGPAAGTCRGYTIGDSLTQFEMYAFGQAWKRLQQELGRS